MRIRYDGTGFNGNVNAALKVVTDEKGKDWPVVLAASDVSMKIPISKEATVAASLTGTTAALALSTNDLVEAPTLAWLGAAMEQALVEDASQINAAAAAKAPFIVPAIL